MASQSVNAVAVAEILTRAFYADSKDIEFGNPWWFAYAGVSCFLVLFAGIMSGLTLGLMSLGLVELEILQQSGTSTERRQAATIFPVVQKQHQLLVTLLLCNAAAMEALPIYLDKLFHPVVAVILSVTFILAFGEVIPQAVCSRYGLAVGANLVWLVRILMIICYPIAFPIGKVLDAVLGHSDALFRRAQLKALVSIHSQEAGRGGELTHDEATIISGALDLTEKTAEEAMTPIESTFSLDVSSKLDWEAIGRILARGHSRIPVFSGNPKNIIGLLLVKSLLTVRAETETPVSAVSIRRMPRVPADMPLYDILNEFQKGSSHMAAVVKVREKEKKLQPSSGVVSVREANLTHLTTPLLENGLPNTFVINIEKASKQNGVFIDSWNHPSEEIEDGEIIGIITLEDVFEELLQEEIVDETDVYIDVHKRIRVAAAAAASSVARAPSTRRLITQKPSSGGQEFDLRSLEMGFNKVYKSLQELFPQIDARVLRAVAIEHSKDADAAVEAVLVEIIPFFTERSKPSSPFIGSIYVGESSTVLTGATCLIPTVQNGCNASDGNQQSVHHADDGHNEPLTDTYDGQQEGKNNVAESTLAEKNQETSIKMSADMNSPMEPVVLVDKNGVNTLQTEVLGDPETEKIVSPDKCPESIIRTSPDHIPCHTLVTVENLDVGVDQGVNLNKPNEDFHNHLENGFCMDTIQENDQGESRGDDNNSQDGPASFATRDQALSTLESSIQFVELPHMHGSNLDKLEVSLSSDTASKMDTTTSIAGSEAESTLNASLSQSSQIHIIEVLEDIITDARSNKKILFSATESVMSLMREVEIQEQAAERAKEEAAMGGTDILNKHAGEVYGEKAILATELRELQSRLFSLSDERDKSLAVLDEMRLALQVRLAAAENIIKSAEQEKLEKENSALKALAEQELIMEKVVEESNTLKQLAEDNAKLEEFLLDRGRVVDMLQGEIAVICKDVRLLKQKFDENVPFSKSVSSSQTSCILASSTSSLKSSIPEQVEPVPDLADSLETQKKTSSSSSSSYEQVSEDEAAKNDRKALVDDGWNFLDSHDIEV
ncbi:hypothetical protein RD792_003354 [Penstemon davidsonii]|uniref:DUF21 domain-containing protein n=1 Tax=Penstemon davidsonii TaxID=160366 RepID=A0ABR0DTL2_9LAMI|nr:hypothetical protein RD792_003354 [Penstemon davidsonii]